MLLRALYDFAQERHLMDDLPIQKRAIHFLVPLSLDGKLIGQGVIPLFDTNVNGKNELGRDLPMPRFPGENNGGKAYFLAESCERVFGRNKETGEYLLADSSHGGNSTKAFRHFWAQVEEAFQKTQLPVLAVLLKFKQFYLIEKDDQIQAAIDWLESRPNRKGKPEFGVRLATGGWEKLKSATLTFQVNDTIVFDGDRSHPLTQYWFDLFPRKAFAADTESDEEEPAARTGICLISGDSEQPIARSHKPKILGVPKLSSGGYVVSFAKDSPAFSSYGFEMGENCSISQNSAACYALALNYLLDHPDHSFRVADMKTCFWAKQSKQVGSFVARLLTEPRASEVRQFLLTPFSGITREILKQDQFFSVTLSGNAGRVVVRHWLQEPLEKAAQHLQGWFRDLDLAVISFTPREDTMLPSVEDMGKATVRDPKDLVSNVAAQLYRAAIEGTPVSLSIINRVLRRIEADLVKYGDGILQTPLSGKTFKEIRDAKQPIPPSGQARFALLKLIINRNRKKTDMEIQPSLTADTDDVAYNCGRLLAVFDALQWRAHEGKLEGPSVVERYFGTASTNPNAAFNILWRLHVHHLKKVSRQGDKGAAAANAIENRITEICARFGQTEAMLQKRQSPNFPRVLDLQAQGRFALGFYQQKAADAEAINKANADRPKSETTKT
jgi:CRISPR-associated protein Csd1